MFKIINFIKPQLTKMSCRHYAAVETQNSKILHILTQSPLNRITSLSLCHNGNLRSLHINEFPSPDKNILRWGIAPVTLMADDFAKALSVLPTGRHEIVSCVGSYRSHALAYAERHNVENVYTSFEDLARCPNVDVVYISPLNPLHCELCHLMLNHDKHVLCEKPLCMTERQTIDLVTKARNRNLFLMEGMWPRCVPAYHYIRKQINRYVLGEVYLMYCTLGFPVPRSKLTLYGGATNDFGVYALQLALWIFREVPANIKTSGTLNEDDVDIKANIELTFSRNRRARIKISAVEELSNEAIIRGTGGSIKMTNFWCPTHMFDSENNKICFPLPNCNQTTSYHNRIGMCYEAEEVRKCVLSGHTESTLFNHNESLLLANIIDTVHEMLGVGKSVTQRKKEDAMICLA